MDRDRRGTTTGAEQMPVLVYRIESRPQCRDYVSFSLDRIELAANVHTRLVVPANAGIHAARGLDPRFRPDAIGMRTRG